MQGKTVLFATRITALMVLALASAVLAQDPPRTHLSGIINDYGPASGVIPAGPWEMRGLWTLNARGSSGKGEFSAALTMELSDYTRTTSNVDSVSGPTSRMHHTHHITMEDADVAQNSGVITVTGPVSITKDGNNVLTGSSLTVTITGGANVEFSNISLAFSGPAAGHFGMQAIHGVVRTSK